MALLPIFEVCHPFSNFTYVFFFFEFLLRDVYEKGMKAFVSFVQFYRKHECSLIFRSNGKENIINLQWESNIQHGKEFSFAPCGIFFCYDWLLRLL